MGIPPGAVVGGTDHSDMKPLYIIQATTDHGVLPGKYNKNKDFGYVPCSGKEIEVSDFQVRFQQKLKGKSRAIFENSLKGFSWRRLVLER